MKLFFRKEGSGPPLVILHGLYGSSDNWLIIARKLASLCTVFMVDLRNHGHSPHHTGHTYAAMVDDLAEFFTDHKIVDAILLGHSMGGKVAMAYAADYPEKIKKLIVVDIAPVNYLETETENQYHSHRNILQAMMGINFGRIKSRNQIEDQLNEKIDDPGICQFLVKNVIHDQVSRCFKWRIPVEILYDNLEEIVGGISLRFFEGRIPICSYPVVFIRGGESPYIQDRYIPLMKQIYPESQIIGIPGAGHWLHAEKTDLFTEVVKREISST